MQWFSREEKRKEKTFHIRNMYLLSFSLNIMSEMSEKEKVSLHIRFPLISVSTHTPFKFNLTKMKNGLFKSWKYWGSWSGYFLSRIKVLDDMMREQESSGICKCMFTFIWGTCITYIIKICMSSSISNWQYHLEVEVKKVWKHLKL